MQRKKLAALATATLTGAAMVLTATAPQVSAAPNVGGDDKAAGAAAPDRVGSDKTSDHLTMPWQRKYEALHEAGVEQKLRSGSRRGVQKLAKGQFANTAQTGTDKIFVVLAEFGDTTHSSYCDSTEEGACAYPYGQPPGPIADPSDPPVSWDGPMHNEIPKPDRKHDNSTNWQRDYDHAHYQHMYFKRMRKFYEKQSMGKYSVDGDVTEWVKVPFNEARYGRDFCGDIVCNNTWFLIRDALAYWTQGKLEAGWSQQRIHDYLETFDQQDRYDFDGDGNFDEPDGYIDHFQIVHAGGDEADGDDQQKGDAIWSHRWYAQIHPADGSAGPTDGAQLGGVNVGEGGTSDPNGANVQVPDNPTDVWVGDYTIQPENGGLSVFAHEFAHDLGLPDLYDTSGNTGGAENSVGWWSLMSQSRGTLPKDDGIGDQPMAFGAWDKFQLGWLDYRTIRAGRQGTFKIKPGQSTKGHRANGLVVILPDKQVSSDLGAPCGECGERYYYSGSGDDLDNSMAKLVEVTAGELTAKVNYDIESGWDYAFLEARVNGEWQKVANSESYQGDDSSGFNTSGTGISGSTGNQWVDLTATLPTGTDALAWSYRTDGAATYPGFKVDNITVDGNVVGNADDVKGWSMDGFRTTTGTETNGFLNAYFVDNRQPRGLDRPLTHLYNFGFRGKNANKVEFFHNQPGALISYWDTSVNDNNVGDHPGSGEILPVDANPEFNHTPDGEIARPRLNSWDSTFTVNRSKGQTLHQNGWNNPFRLKAQRAVRQFNDNLDYWFAHDEHGSAHDGDHFQAGWYSVDVPKTGTQIKVVKVARRTGVMTVRVH